MIETYTDDFAMLLEAGFVAAQQLDEDSATKLFTAAQLLDPQSTAPKIGMASICLHKLEVRRAVKILEEILEQEPDNYRAQAMLGVSILLANQDMQRGKELLTEAHKKTDDAATKKLCELWLEVIESKDTGPAQPQKPKEES